MKKVNLKLLSLEFYSMNIIFFCLEHIKEYNKSWDFYKGLSVNQIESSMREDIIFGIDHLGLLKGNPYNVIEQINNFFQKILNT